MKKAHKHNKAFKIITIYKIRLVVFKWFDLITCAY